LQETLCVATTARTAVQQGWMMQNAKDQM